MGDIIAPRMMQDSMIRIYKNAYTDEFCDKVMEVWETVKRHEFEETSNDWSDIEFRRDKAVFMNEYSKGSKKDKALREDVTNGVMSLLGERVDHYLKDVGLYSQVSCVPDCVKVQKYDHTKGGGYYMFHSEQAPDTQRHLRRLLTYTIYLNDIPEGEGETEYLNQGFRYNPSKGDLVIVPAYFTHTHRGNPVYTTDKYIATGWLLWAQDPEEDVKE